MKIEEAVKWMEEAIQETTECFEECSPALQKELIEQKEVFKLAITALRSMPEAKEPLTVERLREVPHGKIKDSTLQNIANRANEIAPPPAHIDRSKWISVKERLPDKGKNVLVYATAKYIGGEKTAIDRLEEGEKHPIWMYTHGWFEVTHWMPLPEPPEEG